MSIWNKLYKTLFSNQSFYLMHENDILAVFDISNSMIKNIEIISDNKSSRKLPLIVLFSENQELDLSNWLLSRSIPKTRKNIKEDLGSDRFQYLVNNYGLSLVDHYWFKPVYEDYLSWESINLFTNDFKEIYDFRLDNNLDGFTSFTPNASLHGNLQKKWVIDDLGRRVLLKGNTSYTNFLDATNEVFAPEIHKRQNSFNYVNYEFANVPYRGNIITSSLCENFIDINTELIHGNELTYFRYDENNKNMFKRIIKTVNHHYGLDIRNFLEYQILVDFVISNTDRHFRNFGIIRDSKNLNAISYAPIFDSGHSFGISSSYYNGLGDIPTGKDVLKIKVNSFFGTEMDLLKQVKNRGLVNINLLPTDNDLYNLLVQDLGLDEDRRLKIVDLYNTKVKYLYQFQNGCDLWKL